jgi:hypothetical protein
MGTQVEAKNARLDTLAVTIQALHVSGKQMTLAVFRQLPRAIEDEDSELWGIVRYAIKDEGAVWLVFSHDGTLYRRALNLREPWVDGWELGKLTGDLNRAESDLVALSKYRTDSWKEDAMQEVSRLRDLVKEAQSAYDEEFSRKSEWLAREQELAEMTQLFIAV